MHGKQKHRKFEKEEEVDEVKGNGGWKAFDPAERRLRKQRIAEKQAGLNVSSAELSDDDDEKGELS